MGLSHMLDANICIAYLKGGEAAAFRRMDSDRYGVCISSIVYAELAYGVEKSGKRARNAAALEDFVSMLRILPFKDDAAAHYGQIRAELERAGTPIGNNDLLIAAHARAEGLTLVTNNRREFDRVPGLKVETWAV
jgi:tRNA(fMet)-specific endonuclease VapC